MHLDKLRSAHLTRDPFDFLYVPEMVEPEALAAIVRDFPLVPAGGSFDAATLPSGPAFQALLDQLRSDAFRAAIEEKFGLDLSARPLHITVRGQVRGRDGAIHTDSKEKILTGLLYLNPEWHERAVGCGCCAMARALNPTCWRCRRQRETCSSSGAATIPGTATCRRRAAGCRCSSTGSPTIPMCGASWRGIGFPECSSA